MREIPIQAHPSRHPTKQTGVNMQGIACKPEQKGPAEPVRKGRSQTVDKQSSIFAQA